MAWYEIEMPAASLIDGEYHRLCREFQRAFIDSGAPPGLALFAQRMGTSEERRLYLSPHSQTYVPDLIRRYDARTCSVPDPRSVTLVYGVPGAQSLLAVPEPFDAPQKRKETPTIYPITRGRAVASGG